MKVFFFVHRQPWILAIQFLLPKVLFGSPFWQPTFWLQNYWTVKVSDWICGFLTKVLDRNVGFLTVLLNTSICLRRSSSSTSTSAVDVTFQVPFPSPKTRAFRAHWMPWKQRWRWTDGAILAKKIACWQYGVYLYIYLLHLMWAGLGCDLQEINVNHALLKIHKDWRWFIGCPLLYQIIVYIFDSSLIIFTRTG